jgi:ABC-type sugar transport system substrate-binding protein
MGKARVLVALLDEAQPFQVMQGADAREAGARLGLEVEVVFAEGHAVVQIQQLFQRIHAPEEARPRAIVVEATTGEGLERVARNAVRAGMGWILVNCAATYVDELRAAHPELAVAMVGTDQLEVGRIQARQCRALAPQGGKVLCVQGPADSTVTQQRFAGLEEGLGPAFEVRALNGAWTEASGDKAVSSWLRLRTAETFEPRIVAGQNDAMAAGAHSALREGRREWGELEFLGCDGLPAEGQRHVAEGRLAATIVTPSNTGPALEIVARWLESGKGPARETLLAPSSFPPERDLRPRPTR